MTSPAASLDLADLSGTRAVVTGGSSGIGLVIAATLAQAGAEVVLPVRNKAKGQAALERIRAEVTHAEVSLRELDLSSLESVAALGQQLTSEQKPVHLLINNAGVMTPPQRQTTAEGFELQWGSNYLGHFALVGALLPALQSGRARVVSQLSVAANRGAINWADLNWERSYRGMGAYSQSKIALGLFGLELQRRSEAHRWGISSTICHPGVAPTDLFATLTDDGRSQRTLAGRAVALFSRFGLVGTPESAALPALYAAASPNAHPGGFYGPLGFQNISGPPGEQKLFTRLTSTAEAARLWETSEKLTGVNIP